MSALPIKTPGVYIDEIRVFANSVAPVATAVPAFIGYTPQAVYEGTSYLTVPQRISSLADFEAFYCYPDPPAPADAAKQYNPRYYLAQQQAKPATGDYILINDLYYAIVPDPNTIYYLYNSVRLFYQNGGGDAYVVSVGTYGDPSGQPGVAAGQIINPNVLLSDLLAGLALLKNEQEPTMYVCPEATLLSLADNATLIQAMLLQGSELQTAISIFDIIGGRNPIQGLYANDIAAFRESVGTGGLSYGAAYYPFVGASVVQEQEVDYTNIFGTDIKQLATLLNADTDATVNAIIDNIENGMNTVLQNDNALLVASTVYAAICAQVLAIINLLPASGGVAGVITTTDSQRGVWEAPANVTIAGVTVLPIIITDGEQAGLNVDAVSGKSINVIRQFPGRGILIWGARTLDGNSNDWRYISVRRTMTFIEQSCKRAAAAYIFEPNNANTWQAVTAMINSFLTSIWKEGGLQGAKPSDAFFVNCSLSTSMTADDIHNGLLKVMIGVAIIRPAEFTIISFEQQMAQI